MARYNELLVGRFNRFIQKIFSMKGPATLVTVSDELRPVWVFFNGSENRYLESWNRFAGRVVIAAGGVGNISLGRFRNPAGNTAIAVIEKIIWLPGGADNPTLSLSPNVSQPTLSIASQNACYDPRGQLVSTMDFTGKNNTAAGGSTTPVTTTANSAVSVPVEFIITDFQEFPVLPGGSFDVAASVTNQSATMSVVWRERFLEESERQ